MFKICILYICITNGRYKAEKVSLESQKDDNHRHGEDADEVYGRPRLAFGHDDELFVPQGVVVPHGHFQHDVFGAEKRQGNRAVFRRVFALGHGALRQVVNRLLQVEFHPNVISLPLVFAVEHEEVKPVFGNSASFTSFYYMYISYM